MRHYIGEDVEKQAECLNGIVDGVVTGIVQANFYENSIHSFNSTDKLLSSFEMFHENDVVSAMGFKIWRQQKLPSEKKRNALRESQSFFVKLEEVDSE
jgi:hypothetical protein